MLDDSFGFLIPQGELRTHAAWIEWAENEERSAWIGETARSSWTILSWRLQLVGHPLAPGVEWQVSAPAGVCPGHGAQPNAALDRPNPARLGKETIAP